MTEFSFFTHSASRVCPRFRRVIDSNQSRSGLMRVFRLVPLAADSPQLRAVVRGLDAPDRSRARPRDERFGGRSAGVRVAHTLQDISVCDACGREEYIVSRYQIVSREHALEVIPGLTGSRALSLIAGPEAAQQLPVEALHGSRRDDALGGATDPPEEINRRAVGHRQQRCRDITVRDQPNPRTGRPNRRDSLLVTWPVEYNHCHVT